MYVTVLHVSGVLACWASLFAGSHVTVPVSCSFRKPQPSTTLALPLQLLQSPAMFPFGVAESLPQLDGYRVKARVAASQPDGEQSVAETYAQREQL